jgi:hypothetical protein
MVKGEFLAIVINCAGHWERYREFSPHLCPAHECEWADDIELKEIQKGFKKLDFEIMS